MYHNTSIYHINKTNVIVLYSHIKKPVSNFRLCQLFTIKVYMPTVQFAEVPNTSSISNYCCVCAIMVTKWCHLSTAKFSDAVYGYWPIFMQLLLTFCPIYIGMSLPLGSHQSNAFVCMHRQKLNLSKYIHDICIYFRCFY